MNDSSAVESQRTHPLDRPDDDDTYVAPVRKKSGQFHAALAIVVVAVLTKLYLSFVEYARGSMMWRAPRQASEWLLLLALSFTVSYAFGRVTRARFNNVIAFLMALLGGGLATAHCDRFGAIYGGFLSIPVAATLACHADRPVIRVVWRSAVIALLIGLVVWLLMPRYILMIGLALPWRFAVFAAAAVPSVILWRTSYRWSKDPPPRRWWRTGILFVHIVLLIALTCTFVEAQARYRAGRRMMMGRLMYSVVFTRSNFQRMFFRWFGMTYRVGQVHSYGDGPAPEVLAELRYFPEVYSLQLTVGPGVKDEHLRVICEMPNLTTLHLHGTGATSEILEYLPPGMRSLNIRGFDLDDEAARKLRKQTKLLDLSIGHWTTSDEMTAEVLRNNPNLLRLDLRGLTLGPETIQAIAAMPMLASLGLRDTNVTDADLQIIAKAVGIVDMDLSGTKVTSRGLAVFTKYNSLMTLRLNRRKLTSADMVQLAKLKLRSLELNHASVDDGLMPAVSGLTSLATLSLIGNPVTDKSLPQFLKLTSIEVLNLRRTKVGRGIRALRRLPLLLELNVEKTQIKKADVNAVQGTARRVKFSPDVLE